MKKENNSKEQNSQIVFYHTEDDKTEIEVKLDHETVWLTQNQMVHLFDSSKSNISEHIKAIFLEGELESDSIVRKFRTVQNEGSRNVVRDIE